MNKRQNVLFLILPLIIALSPLIIRAGADFGGTDDQVEGVVTTLRPDYKPWANPLWTPPSGEVESFLFALQAAAGAGFIGYFIGYRRGQAAKRSE